MRVMPTTTLGLDIGGANLKAATADGRAASVPFALWKSPDQLGTALAALIAQFDGIDELAATMTGELCDCYRTKREGVGRILTCLESAAGGRTVRVWGTDGAFHSAEVARQNPVPVAAANWHALATFAGRFVPQGDAVLIDIGSTTTDVIPLQNAEPIPRGLTDADRMRGGELIYTGVRRTPLCALIPGGYLYVSAELFATTLDVWLSKGEIGEDAGDCDTADGRPATREFARERVARMLGADGETVDPDDLSRYVHECAEWQLHLVRSAVRFHFPRLRPPVTPILSGSGEFLARLAVSGVPELAEPLSLTERLGPGVAASAPAYAVAVLAGETPR